MYNYLGLTETSTKIRILHNVTRYNEKWSLDIQTSFKNRIPHANALNDAAIMCLLL